MTRVKYTTADGRLSFEFEAATPKDVFRDLAGIQEVFEEPACGCCNSKRIRFMVRETDGNAYYKLRCNACGAQLDAGQHKVGGTLFLKRRDADGHAMPNAGWYVWQGGHDDGPPPTPRPTPRAAPSGAVQRPAARSTPSAPQHPARTEPPRRQPRLDDHEPA